MNFFTFAFSLLMLLPAFAAAADAPPDYAKDVVPVLRKYCTGCHNAEDKEGGLSLETFADITRGGKTGPALTAGSPDSSRLIGMLTGKIEPVMPPEGSDAPTAAEIAMLSAWIKSGSKGPAGAEPDRTRLQVPKIVPMKQRSEPVTAIAWSHDGNTLAVGRFGKVEFVRARKSPNVVRTINGLPGKVNSLQFSGDGQKLLVGTGVSGLYGLALLFDVDNPKPLLKLQGHRDSLYSAVLSPDAKTIATASYDNNILLWDVATGKQRLTLSGHNGAVYDLAFSPDGRVLASASGDETGKVWSTVTGERLDTLSQPQGEQYAIAFSPDGKHIVSAGADNRIRVWQFISQAKQRINPLLHARFAHEGGIVALAYSPDGELLATSSEDRVIKLWETRNYTEVHAWENQSDATEAIAFSPDAAVLVVGRMDGSRDALPIPANLNQSGNAVAEVKPKLVPMTTPMQNLAEAEPNDHPATAMPVELPAVITGRIHAEATGKTSSDVDVYRITAKAGEQWVLETNAARSKSPLDSKIEVLDAQGQRILRVNLQAQRDSWFTFRGKDSDTSDDFRVQNWQEMELDNYLYAGGEVVRLWLYPRGPDSGFKVYPGRGKRHTMFDTPALSHALGEPCYIVKPIPPGQSVVPNGLPVFPVYYENDDDGRRKLGADSQLYFTAPADGEYLVRVSDVRGFGGEDYKYSLTIRPRQPDFRVKLIGANPNVPAGSAKEFRVEAERLDNFEGEIRVDIENIPPGFQVTTPLVILRGQDQAFGVISADADATAPKAEVAKASKVKASADIAGKPVARPVNNLGEIKLDKPPQLTIRLAPADRDGSFDPAKPLELTLAPGETVTARVIVERNGHKGNVSFGKDDSGRNLPFGCFVDNIGLNGLLILPDKNERLFFITASPIAEETTRTFHLTANGQASLPAIIHVRRK